MIVRGGGRCSRFYLGVCGIKLVSVRTWQQPGLIGVAGNGELVLVLRARLPSEGPKGSSGGMRGGRCEVWRRRIARARAKSMNG
eukprot:2840849-Prymnesium_polylepis.1